MSRMSGKKQGSWIESVRDAATGYATVVLGIACFLLALVIVVAGVRVITSAGLPSATTAAQTDAAANTIGSKTA